MFSNPQCCSPCQDQDPNHERSRASYPCPVVLVVCDRATVVGSMPKGLVKGSWEPFGCIVICHCFFHSLILVILIFCSASGYCMFSAEYSLLTNTFPHQQRRRRNTWLSCRRVSTTLLSSILHSGHTYVLLLAGQLLGRSAQHMPACLGSIFALKCFTQYRLSVSMQGQLQFSPSHQRSTSGLVGHQPMLGGFPSLYFTLSL